MTKTEMVILDACDPAAYIEASLRARITPAAKARLAKLWMEKTGYSKEDILYARNRHPYWKKKKMEGSAERTRNRLAAHDYSRGGSIDWTEENVQRFLDLNGKDRAGRYEHRDWEIAEAFGASIPSIQYMRRKHRRAVELLGAKASRSRLVEYLTYAESVLVRGQGAVEKLRTERAKTEARPAPRKAAAARPAAKAKAARSKSVSASKAKTAAKKTAKPKTAGKTKKK